MNKPSLSTILSIVLCVVLVVGAICIGTVRGWNDEREELLLRCVELHTSAGNKLQDSINKCEDAVEDFDERLADTLSGKIAALFGVEPIGHSVDALHQQLLHDHSEQKDTDGSLTLEDLQNQIGDLLDDHIDTTLSFGKVVWTVILLIAIFGKKGRKKGFTLGKFLAGFGLFNLWKKR